MKIIQANYVDQALIKGVLHLIDNGELQNSRNGEVLVAKTPVVTEYHHPRRRVLFHEKRDANPFFHFLESIWMLAGRNDALWISKYNKRMNEYADQGQFHGAYGFRWRRHFALDGDSSTDGEGGFDQIERIVELLNKNPLDRRIVLSMWDPMADLGASYKDLPCNTHIYFRVRDKTLDMTVCNRSNDAIWGAHGANAVHMSILQEYIAARLGLGVGKYYQISNNYHVYTDVLNKLLGVDFRQDYSAAIANLSNGIENRYEKDSECLVIDILPSVFNFDEELPKFMREAVQGVFSQDYRSLTFKQFAIPMVKAYDFFKQKDFSSAYRSLEQMPSCDWRKSCREWLQRREKRHV